MHVPVLFDEVMQALQPRSGGRYLDCTLGGGGHTEGILNASAPDGRVLATDADADAIARVSERLRDALNNRLTLQQAWLDEAPAVAQSLGFVPLDGILVDLGLSSDQLASAERGFSFMRDGPLDMRFNRVQGEPAWALIEHMDVQSLTKVLREYGEVRNARRVAEAIWQARPIMTTGRLRDVVAGVARTRSDRIHPATQVFQALRIAVNDELRRLKEGLPKLIEILRPGGRIAVITFHSLEDRIVKETFRRESRDEVAQPGFGMGEARPARLRLVNKQPIRPSAAEVARNPRARSAKLRVAERVMGERGEG
ncbi:MAG: 16S rRNA (cytosine(1402)-N(4))-methyltransferase RsmH [Anaerolineae bacterium]|nr:16S rRNA (cytosine(1402)-N(4))-methyltransferase RsmH [Candidatus Roseilinea sp.]MDW8448633.1 16S rRNA (cytosine(1402)-N(4))-methyltransferase RsmH [Anaerolineae bacterium]